MADALSRKNTITTISLREWELVEVINFFGLELSELGDRVYLGCVSAWPTLIQKVLDA